MLGRTSGLLLSQLLSSLPGIEVHGEDGGGGVEDGCEGGNQSSGNHNYGVPYLG
jgi:hypothetical protein